MKRHILPLLFCLMFIMTCFVIPVYADDSTATPSPTQSVPWLKYELNSTTATIEWGNFSYPAKCYIDGAWTGFTSCAASYTRTFKAGSHYVNVSNDYGESAEITITI